MPDRPQLPTAGPRARRTRRSHGLAVLLVVVLAAAGCVPLVSPATSGRQYGQGPVDAIWDAAAAQPKCAGLTSAELAAMMLVPTYPEAGGTVPSPMTLSRWDNLSVSSSNANLFAFGQTTGPYVNAFFSPGIGLWQFDSAGGWPMTAADAIDSVTAARQAAQTISYRYCNPAPSVPGDDASLRRYAWGPWYGCSSSSNTNCEQLYSQLYANELLNLTPDQTVGRFGGMEQRTCDLGGVGNGLTCWYVDPARAQGSTSWRAGTYDPARPNYVTPLPKPFYVISANNREYRVWLPDDTGFDIGVTASKPITANARTSLAWDSTANLCDRTAGRGACGTTARVASTPWGPRSADPIGALDSVTGRPDGSAEVTGWAIDPDTNDPIDVHVYVDGAWGGLTTAAQPRPDVAAAIPGYGTDHGYDTVVNVGAGTHQVCAYAINVGPFGTTNPSLGCRNVTVDGNPLGNLEAVSASVAGLRLSGWTFDADTAGPIDVHVYVDGAWGGMTSASLTRDDVGAAYPRVGAAHGFDLVVPTTSGSHQACAYAINVGPNGTTNPLLGCGTATVQANPIGNFESAAPTAGGVLVSGWGFDPDTNDATAEVSVDGAVVRTLPTGTARDDVAAAYPGRGPLHGFSGTVPASPGNHQVCVRLLNAGPGTSTSLGCRPVTVMSGDPFGNLELVGSGPGGIRVVGWAIDPDATAPVALHVYVDGAFRAQIQADVARDDLAFWYPGYGAAHGFDASVTGTAGSTVCVFAINTGPGTQNPLLGCRTS